MWRQDVSKSPYWKINIQRIGQASVADLYFEPPTKDLIETELELTLTFDDKSTAKATLKATGHTSDQERLKFQPTAQLPMLIDSRPYNSKVAIV